MPLAFLSLCLAIYADQQSVDAVRLDKLCSPEHLCFFGPYPTTGPYGIARCCLTPVPHAEYNLTHANCWRWLTQVLALSHLLLTRDCHSSVGKMENSWLQAFLSLILHPK